MPIFAVSCAAGHEAERYIHSWRDENPACSECGASTERIPKVSRHVPASGYPYVTRNISGKPIEVRSSLHEAELCRQYGVNKRDDVAWVEETYEGYDHRAKAQKYSRGSQRGMKGQWV